MNDSDDCLRERVAVLEARMAQLTPELISTLTELARNFRTLQLSVTKSVVRGTLLLVALFVVLHVDDVVRWLRR